MQSLKDYLTSTQQYEGILDPNQDQVMSRMTDDTIRSCIREYCTYGSGRNCWIVTYPGLKINKIGKDQKGWYIDTEDSDENAVEVMYEEDETTFYDYCSSYGQKIDEQKGFLIEDVGVYFRWRKHKGILAIVGCPDLESITGLPEKFDGLYLHSCCTISKKLTIHNKITAVIVEDMDGVNISGDGYKNIVIHYLSNPINITTPSGVEKHYPRNKNEYMSLIKKFTKL